MKCRKGFKFHSKCYVCTDEEGAKSRCSHECGAGSAKHLGKQLSTEDQLHTARKDRETDLEFEALAVWATDNGLFKPDLLKAVGTKGAAGMRKCQ